MNRYFRSKNDAQALLLIRNIHKGLNNRIASSGGGKFVSGIRIGYSVMSSDPPDVDERDDTDLIQTLRSALSQAEENEASTTAYIIRMAILNEIEHSISN